MCDSISWPHQVQASVAGGCHHPRKDPRTPGPEVAKASETGSTAPLPLQHQELEPWSLSRVLLSVRSPSLRCGDAATLRNRERSALQADTCIPESGACALRSLRPRASASTPSPRSALSSTCPPRLGSCATRTRPASVVLRSRPRVTGGTE
jgi:hypothetical protein